MPLVRGNVRTEEEQWPGLRLSHDPRKLLTLQLAVERILFLAVVRHNDVHHLAVDVQCGMNRRRQFAAW